MVDFVEILYNGYVQLINRENINYIKAPYSRESIYGKGDWYCCVSVYYSGNNTVHDFNFHNTEAGKQEANALYNLLKNGDTPNG